MKLYVVGCLVRPDDCVKLKVMNAEAAHFSLCILNPLQLIT